MSLPHSSSHFLLFLFSLLFLFFLFFLLLFLVLQFRFVFTRSQSVSFQIQPNPRSEAQESEASYNDVSSNFSGPPNLLNEKCESRSVCVEQLLQAATALRLTNAPTTTFTKMYLPFINCTSWCMSPILCQNNLLTVIEFIASSTKLTCVASKNTLFRLCLDRSILFVLV